MHPAVVLPQKAYIHALPAQPCQDNRAPMMEEPKEAGQSAGRRRPAAGAGVASSASSSARLFRRAMLPARCLPAPPPAALAPSPGLPRRAATPARYQGGRGPRDRWLVRAWAAAWSRAMAAGAEGRAARGRRCCITAKRKKTQKSKDSKVTRALVGRAWPGLPLCVLLVWSEALQYLSIFAPVYKRL